jgi:hypothetical protein
MADLSLRFGMVAIQEVASVVVLENRHVLRDRSATYKCCEYEDIQHRLIASVNMCIVKSGSSYRCTFRKRA